MDAFKIETTVLADGELHLTELPCRKGDRVEAIVLVLNKSSTTESSPEFSPDEKRREEALQSFLARAKASKFCSTGPYPTRDELHERD